MRQGMFALALAAMLTCCPALAVQETSGPTLPELAALIPPAPLPKEAVPSFAVLIGDCAAGQPILVSGEMDSGGARPVGDLTSYTTLIQIIAVPNGFARARANAIWDNDDRRNVLGFLRAGSYVWAEGPLKNGEFSAGLGWAVPVRDLSGKECRAYLSHTVVRVIFNGQMTQSDLDRITAEQASKFPEPSAGQGK